MKCLRSSLGGMTELRDAGRSREPIPETVVVLDAKGLRALAHPVRVQLVGLLRRHGPATATQLAQRMGLTSGATSYHLRQLAAAGFIDEDSQRGNARERWWKSLHQKTWFNDTDLIEHEPEAALGYLQSVAAAYTLHTQRALNEFQTMPREWRHTLNLSDWALRLTPQEARQLQDELESVVARYRSDSPQTRADAPDDAVRVAVITHLLPEPGAADPELGTNAVPEGQE
jgi:DNA-binding transcriptional ArsR family regulator